MSRPAVIVATTTVAAFAAAVFLWSVFGGDGDRGGDGEDAAEKAAGASATPGDGAGSGARPSLLPAPDAPGSARLTGAVMHRRTGAAVAGVLLRFVGPVEVTEESASDGAYAVALAPGAYRVAIDRPGLRSVGPQTVRVASGAIVDGVDLVVDDESRVAGRVVSSAGDPLVGAALTCRGPAADRGDLACSAASGRGGLFEIAVPAGAVELVAVGPAGRGTGSLALPWVLPGAELSGVEVVVDAAGALDGTVRAPSGAPQAGATVRVWPAPPTPRGGGPQPLAGDPLVFDTGAGGRFDAVGLPVGALYAVAGHPDFAPSTATRVEVTPGGRVAGVSLVLRKPLAIAGRVVDEAGVALAGAVVRARRVATGEQVARAAADDRGRFELRGLDRGPFDLLAEVAGRSPGRRSALSAPAEGVVLEAPRPSAVAGTATSAGAPVTDFRVHLHRHVPVGGGPPAPDSAPVRVVDPGGRFRFDDLEPGSYQLSVSAPGLGPALVSATAPAGATGRADVELRTGSVLVGRVTAADSGRAIAGALVTASTGFAGDGAYTDERGEYRLRDIAAGRRSVGVVHPAYVGKIESAVEFGVGDRRRLDVKLEPRRAGEAGGQVIEFAGIGAVISMNDGVLAIGDVLEHSPAAVAGLESGDQLVRIDGVATAGRTLADNIEDIRGLVGTSVRLEIVRGRERFTRDVVRGTVRFRQDEP